MSSSSCVSARAKRGYYYGAMQLGDDAIWTGLGQIGYPASVGKPDPVTLTHELGHNMGLRHAPCRRCQLGGHGVPLQRRSDRGVGLRFQ